MVEFNNIMLLGFGPHAKRIFFPLIQSFSKKLNFKLVLAVDLEEKEKDIKNYLKMRGEKIPLLFIKQAQKTYHKLHPDFELLLNEEVKKRKIKGVIISTEPLTHVMYAKWALKNNLHILMDKPISTYENVSTQEKLAKRLVKDFNDLERMYLSAIKRKDITFSLMAQRRFHPSIKKIKEVIKDCFKKTNCPITSIQSFQSDGQWRMPTEIVEQLYHPYKQGYGKCSHSGYHFFDIVPFLLESGLGNGKYYDNIDIYTSFVRPLDFLEQLTLDDYKRIFRKENFSKYNNYDMKQLNRIMKNFGEIDAFTNLTFKKKDKVITLCSINLVHNGFARRDWITARGRDLYKGNGRVKHEYHILEQGPFQAIHYHSYQSKDVYVNQKKGLYDVGGEYHLDIYVFRNTKMIGGKELEVFKVKDLNINILKEDSMGHQRDARTECFLEFIEAMSGKRTRKNMNSDFLSHKSAVLITSGIYRSAAAQLKNKNPKINIDFKLGHFEGLDKL